MDGVAAVDSQGWQQRLRQQPEKASAKPGKRVSSVFLACFPGCAEDGVGISRVVRLSPLPPQTRTRTSTRFTVP